jgi:hypothetical protein
LFHDGEFGTKISGIKQGIPFFFFCLFLSPTCHTLPITRRDRAQGWDEDAALHDLETEKLQVE